MATRNVSLTAMLDQFVEDRVESGAYQNASEVVRAGLRLLQAQEDAHRARVERLRAAIQIGIDELDRGEGVEIEWDDLDDWLDSLGRPGAK
jgi:antitoxin ParD1/3/4